jgi:hypothetical protein
VEPSQNFRGGKVATATAGERGVGAVFPLVLAGLIVGPQIPFRPAGARISVRVTSSEAALLLKSCAIVSWWPCWSASKAV